MSLRDCLDAMVSLVQSHSDHSDIQVNVPKKSIRVHLDVRAIVHWTIIGKNLEAVLCLQPPPPPPPHTHTLNIVPCADVVVT